MHRSLWTSFRSLADSRCTSKLLENARGDLWERLKFSRLCTSSEGRGSLMIKEHPFVRPLQLKIVNALRSGQRDQASTLLSTLCCGNETLRADDFIYVLDYCARSPDPLFVMETWRFMEEKAIEINKKCCTYIIRALSKGGFLEEALYWLTNLGGSQHINPALYMYNIFLNGCIDRQSINPAIYCLKLMEDRSMGKSEITYWELLKFAVREKNLPAVHEIWNECTKIYSPSILSLRKFVWSFAKLGDLTSACEILQRMIALAFRGSSCLKTSPDGRFQAFGLDIPIPSRKEFSRRILDTNGDSSFDPLLEDRMNKHTQCRKEDLRGYLDNPALMPNAMDATSAKKDNIAAAEARKNCSAIQIGCPLTVHSYELGNAFSKPEVSANARMASVELMDSGHITLKDITATSVRKLLRWSFSDVMHGCARAGNFKLVEQLFLKMQSIGLEPSQHTYDGIVKAVLSERGVKYGMRVVKAMEMRNMKPYAATIAALSAGYSNILEVDLAEALLDHIALVEGPGSYVHPFNALLAACDVLDQPERAVRILAKMKKLKIKFDIRTYELLFSLFGNVNAPYEKGNVLSKADAAKRIHAIEMDMVKNGVHHSLISMENLLKALGGEGMVRELIHYLRVAESLFGLTNTHIVMYNTVLHALVEAKDSHTAIELFRNLKLCDLPPDAATYNIMIDCCSIIRCYKSACSIISMMLRDGFSLDTCTYTALIKIVLINEDFEKALQLLDQAIAEAIQPDVVLFNSILLEAYLKGRIDILELIIERMHEEKIQPDPNTCSYTFSAYVDQGFLNTAVEAFKVLSLRMISEEEEVLLQEKARFEALVLNEDPDTDSKIVSIFKESENISVALLNLRWCTIAGIDISWSPNESLWARRLSSCYGSRQ